MFDTNINLVGKSCCHFQQLIRTVGWLHHLVKKNTFWDISFVFAVSPSHSINTSLPVCSTSFVGQDLLNHFLHPGSLWVQANLLACLLQSGNDLSLFTVGVGRNQLHLGNVAANGFALCLDAAAMELYTQAPQTHPC